MRLSYSLLAKFARCEYLTQQTVIERKLREPETRERLLGPTLGSLAHAVQAGVFLDGGGERRAEAEATRLGLKESAPDDWMPLCARACEMTERWARFFRPWEWNPVLHPDVDSPAVVLVDAPLYICLDPPLGVFDELVIKPDLVATHRESGRVVLWDWKWRASVPTYDGLTDTLAFDLQSAIYQWGLARLGLVVCEHGQVVGSREEPTEPAVNKDGSLSRRVIRCAWDEYAEAVRRRGLLVEDYADMRGRLEGVRFFSRATSFRPPSEVDAVWTATVVPRALRLSRAIESGTFERVMEPALCGRCGIREECLNGLVTGGNP
jgi:hypothetical protein